MKHESARHPANKGKVMLMGWVSPTTRDMVRVYADGADQSVSAWLDAAVWAWIERQAKYGPTRGSPLKGKVTR